MVQQHFQFSWRVFSIWRRHALVWKKMAVTSILSSIADPLIFLFGLGYGLGMLLPKDLPQLGGSYMIFLATGTVCASTMNTASFEALYSAFSRMHVQKTWEAILNAPVSLDDIVLSELLWAASKALISGAAVLIVIYLLGFTHSPMALLTLPIIFLIGLTFGALGLIMTTLAKDYSFFMYYFTLFITPMSMLSGVFFPIEQLPPAMQVFTQFLPLTHAVELVRPLLFGEWPKHFILNILVLSAITVIAFVIANTLARRRLMT